MNFEHKPVMAKEIIVLASEIKVPGIMVDATLGGAGHSSLLLEAFPDRRLIAFDRDMEAINASEAALSSYSDRVEIIHSGYKEIGEEIRKRKKDGEVAIVLFDLGVSSHQLDRRERGFTYRHDDAPLDMRMDSAQDLTAEFIVNEYSQEEIEKIIRDNSDEKFARAIAREIVAARPLATAGELVEAIRKAIPNKFQRLNHPAKRTFQALRMEVNKEISQLEQALEESVHLLAPGGRILVLSYHSGEDRIVKNIFEQYSEKNELLTKDGRILPITDDEKNKEDVDTVYSSQVRLIKVPAPKKPSKKEVLSNPRSKSARLRVAERTNDKSVFPNASGM